MPPEPAPPARPAPALPAALLAELYAHARASYPAECCGLLIGPREAGASGAEIDELRRCDNQQDALHAEDPARFPRDARTAYHLGARDLLALDRSLRGPRPVRVVYHSHVEVGAYFSDEDHRAATFDGEPTYPAIDYLVVDVRRAGCRGARLYRFSAATRRFEEIARYPGEPGAPGEEPPP